MNETSSTIQVKTVKGPPFKLDFIDFINCPICDIEIDVYNQIINDGSLVYCEDCEHMIIFEVVKI